MRTTLALVLLILMAATQAISQPLYLSGYVRDSTTFDLLPYATIHTIHGKPVAAANENGYFSLQCSAGDTIVFTRLGYKPVKFAPTETAWDMNVLLPETIRMLENVVVYDHYIIHGHEEIQKSLKETAAQESSSFKNQTQAPTSVNMIQTFGPGMVFNGVLSKLVGVDKEKRKLAQGKAEFVKTQVYQEVIQSPQVRDYLSRLFTLEDSDYFKKLERFKLDYPTAVYITSREEIIKLMVSAFALK